jgi:hypothetical protein
MQAELAKRDRVASLATLAAGAAHELNTPLGTIAVVARELELFATNTARNDAVAEDSRLIRTEVDRLPGDSLAYERAGHANRPRTPPSLSMPGSFWTMFRKKSSNRAGLRYRSPASRWL